MASQNGGKVDPNFLSLEWYRQAFEKSSVGMLFVGETQNITDVNPALCRLLGYTKEELSQKSVVEIVYPEDVPWCIEKLQKLFGKAISSCGMEKRFVAKSGDIVWVNISASVVGSDKKGKPTSLFVAVDDITTRKRLETALKESELLYHALVELSPDGIAIHAEGKIIFVNQAGTRMLGAKKAEEIVGKPTMSFVHPDSQTAVVERMKKMAEDNRPVPLITEKFVRLDGSVIEVGVAASPIIYMGKKAVQVVIHDLTEQKKSQKAVIESEARYRSLAEAAHDMIFVLDRTGTITYVNSFAAGQFGLRPEDMIGRKKAEFFGPSSETQDISLRKVFESGQPFYRETRTPFKDKMLWLGTWLVPLAENGKEVTGILGVSRDISVQKEAELELLKLNRTLKEGEEKIKKEKEFTDNVLNSLPGIYYLFDQEGKFQRWNNNLVRIGEYSVEEMLQRVPTDFFAKEEAAILAEKIKEVFEKGSANMEAHLLTKGGKAIPYYLSGVRIEIDGKVMVSGMGVDITDRKKAEEELKKSEESLQTSTQLLNRAQEVAQLGVYTFDAKTGSWESSELLDRVFGIDKTYPRTIEAWLEIVHPDHRQEMRKYFIEEVLGKKVRFDKEYKIRRVGDGQERWVHGLGDLEFDSSSGDVARMIGTIQDITARKEAERQKDEFVMIANHELRAPMTAVRWQISMILDGTYGPIDSRLVEPLSVMRVSADRLIELVNDMINVSRIEAGGLKLRASDFDIKKLITDLVVTFGSEVKKKGLVFDLSGVKSVSVHADVDKTAQILSNLIDNATKFTDDNMGKISLGVEVDDGKVRITVADTGMGIPPDFRDKLFGKFAQAVTGVEGKPRGTGLGLYISRELARSMAGNLVLVSSEVGNGSVFALTLPAESAGRPATADKSIKG